jgi:hypothetical protein
MGGRHQRPQGSLADVYLSVHMVPHTAAAIMWNSGMVTVVPAMALVVLAWMADDERRVVREERRRAASQS